MSRGNWATINAASRARERGTEDASGKHEGPRSWVVEEKAMRGRALRYLTTTSSAERDVGPLLDEMMFRFGTGVDGASIWVSRAVLDSWLRGVLDACED